MPEENQFYFNKSCEENFEDDDIEPKPNDLKRKEVEKIVRSYDCEDCGKSFKNNSTLINHKLSHSDEIKFECPICGRGFKLKGNLKTHLVVHENKKKYRCAICKKRFNLKGNAKDHYLKVHCKNL
jgi:KRAB domain-containing zinc finger protein